jgi:allantoicase
VSEPDGFTRLRAMSLAQRAEVLRGCCASMRWSARVAAELDACADEAALHELSERVWWELTPADWREALDAHPKIGDRPPDGSQESREQGAMATAGPALRDEIAAGNVAYEARFGMTYVVRARGRSPGELLLLLRQRLGNEPEAELRIAAGEQAEITRLRLADVVAQDRAA